MIKSLTYKQLFYLYLAVILIGFFIIFKIAVNPTIALRREYFEKKEVLETVSMLPAQIKKISNTLSLTDRQFESYSVEGNLSRDNILEEISVFCNKNGITVSSYPETHLFASESIVIETNRIELKSDFKRLLRLINYLESKSNLGKIVSIDFHSVLNRKSKQKELYLELFFQNIRKNE